MKAVFDKLFKGTPREKLSAFVTIEDILPKLHSLDHMVKSDFEAFGQWLSEFDSWDENQKSRFFRRASAVQTHAELAGLVYDEKGQKVR